MEKISVESMDTTIEEENHLAKNETISSVEIENEKEDNQCQDVLKKEQSFKLKRERILNKGCHKRIYKKPNVKTAKMIESIVSRVNPNSTDDEEKVYPCAYCEYLSKTVEEMKEHKILHQQEHKPHKCERCSFSCREASTLKLHRLVHVPDKPFICDVCGFKAKLMYLLTKHKVVHSEKKPYACNECSYTAKWLTNLRAHKKSHDKEPLYNCNTCEFTCRHAEVMEEHKRRHTLVS